MSADVSRSSVISPGHPAKDSKVGARYARLPLPAEQTPPISDRASDSANSSHRHASLTDLEPHWAAAIDAATD